MQLTFSLNNTDATLVFPNNLVSISTHLPKKVNKRIMVEFKSIFFTISALCVISWAWRLFNWIWLKPKKIEKFLREQGIKGTTYNLLYGDALDMGRAVNEATSEPMELSHQIAPRVAAFANQNMEKYGKISFHWYGTVPVITFLDPDMIRDVLSNKSGHIEQTPIFSLAELFVTGILSCTGEKWTKHRRILTPAFYQEKLRVMLPAFDTCCREMVEKWQKLVSKGSIELDVWPELQNLTADFISRAGFGSSYEVGKRIFQLQTEQAMLYVEASQTMHIPGIKYFPTKRNRKMKEIYREVQSLLRDVIKKREKAMKNGEAQNNDLLGLLLESNFKEIKDKKSIGITMDEVVEECKLLYLAGQETTSILLVWTMVVLSMNRDWQEKAREEVLQVFGKNVPDFDGLNQLKIVTMILNEVLRLYPPVSQLVRTTYGEVKLGEIILPAGVQISLQVLMTHHDRELWGDDAQEFKPERFSKGVSKATNNRLSFFPFGGGPRICIGQSFSLVGAKMAIAMILQCFAFELSPGYTHAPYTVLSLQPKHGAKLIVYKL